MLQTIINRFHIDLLTSELVVNYVKHRVIFVLLLNSVLQLFLGPPRGFVFLALLLSTHNPFPSPISLWHSCACAFACEMTGLPLTRRVVNSDSVFKSTSHFWEVPALLLCETTEI